MLLGGSGKMTGGKMKMSLVGKMTGGKMKMAWVGP